MLEHKATCMIVITDATTTSDQNAFLYNLRIVAYDRVIILERVDSCISGKDSRKDVEADASFKTPSKRPLHDLSGHIENRWP